MSRPFMNFSYKQSMVFLTAAGNVLKNLRPQMFEMLFSLIAPFDSGYNILQHLPSLSCQSGKILESKLGTYLLGFSKCKLWYISPICTLESRALVPTNWTKPAMMWRLCKPTGCSLQQPDCTEKQHNSLLPNWATGVEDPHKHCKACRNRKSTDIYSNITSPESTSV